MHSRDSPLDCRLLTPGAWLETLSRSGEMEFRDCEFKHTFGFDPKTPSSRKLFAAIFQLGCMMGCTVAGIAKTVATIRFGKFSREMFAMVLMENVTNHTNIGKLWFRHRR